MSADHAIEHLRLLYDLRQYFHNALWEEEKHFTWLLSLIAGAEAALLTGRGTVEHRLALVSILSVLGLALAMLALRAIRAESRNFQDALQRFVLLYNQLFPDRPFRDPGGADTANRSVLGLLDLRKLKIRDAFQVIYLLFGVLNLVVLALVLLRAA